MSDILERIFGRQVLMVPWSALARRLEGSRVTHAIGRVAIATDDGGHYAASL